ncbi:unnamed protein product (macronuclear) [Paramecium tetraurelia]|uniref:Uncharacterized protein n=1 Tax=Paramecium tetraurelia TaxID=5888 RepID=A0CEZ6_PARTE|nr:uncharacterized protein GSPATT00037802001 [Paramecium tetraurelia]CAK69363.1 unnamed protein product [Paramecium tetraurelia]|eukprot:XP_001436760.1 hypothetical protein (macronuclear) [Paramecium tetraurelia strain d4-2]
MWFSKTVELSIEIGIGVIEIILLMCLIYYVRKIHKKKNYYPIYQLSPITTILQGISFYIFQLTIVLNFYYIKTYDEITWDICLDQNENENANVEINTIYKKAPYYRLLLHIHTYEVIKNFDCILKIKVIKKQCNSKNLYGGSSDNTNCIILWDDVSRINHYYKLILLQF